MLQFGFLRAVLYYIHLFIIAEVGCREGPNENIRRLPWFINYRDNFPYVDLITTRQQEPSSSRLRRSSRDRGRHQNVVVHSAEPATEHVQPNMSCIGESIEIKITGW